MWKPDVHGRGKTQRAFRNRESHNSASETELFFSTMGPGHGQGGCMKGEVIKPICTLTVGWACAQTQGEMGWAGALLSLSQPHSSSTTTSLMFTSLIPGMSRGTASTAAAQGIILHQFMRPQSPHCRCPHVVTAAVAGHKASKRLLHQPTGDVGCNTTTHKQEAGCCSNVLNLRSSL